MTRRVSAARWKFARLGRRGEAGRLEKSWKWCRQRAFRMTQLSSDAAMRAAVLHHQAGRAAEAEALYRQVLAQNPQQSAAWHFLGVLAFELKRADVACELIGRSIALDPGCAEAHSNFSHALFTGGR